MERHSMINPRTIEKIVNVKKRNTINCPHDLENIYNYNQKYKMKTKTLTYALTRSSKRGKLYFLFLNLENTNEFFMKPTRHRSIKFDKTQKYKTTKESFFLKRVLRPNEDQDILFINSNIKSWNETLTSHFSQDDNLAKKLLQKSTPEKLVTLPPKERKKKNTFFLNIKTQTSLVESPPNSALIKRNKNKKSIIEKHNTENFEEVDSPTIIGVKFADLNEEKSPQANKLNFNKDEIVEKTESNKSRFNKNFSKMEESLDNSESGKSKFNLSNSGNKSRLNKIITKRSGNMNVFTEENNEKKEEENEEEAIIQKLAFQDKIFNCPDDYPEIEKEIYMFLEQEGVEQVDIDPFEKYNNEKAQVKRFLKKQQLGGDSSLLKRRKIQALNHVNSCDDFAQLVNIKN